VIKIRTNSKKIEPGDVFVALSGNQWDGHDFIEEAILKGASKIIAEHGEYSIPYEIVPDSFSYLINYLKEFYSPMIQDLTLIGITGTNGKTTTAYLIYQLLTHLGKKTSYIGTIGYYGPFHQKTLDHTTPSIDELYNLLVDSKEEGSEVVVLEVSSHALQQNRVAGLTFATAIFTNLTEDHLDYHHTMEAYAACKRKLFDQLFPNGKALINADDPYGTSMVSSQNTVLTYGFTKSDYQITNYTIDHFPIEFTLQKGEDIYSVSTPFLGKHNIYNLVAALLACESVGFSLTKILPYVKELKAPMGRMDTIFSGTNAIIVDYAHTPDAIKNVLNSVKQFSKGKIYSIIGCGGDRDKSKRRFMAEAGCLLSDDVIMTSDNPRSEDPMEIITDMIRDLPYHNYEIVLDRKEAIRLGIAKLKEHDILLILGKGHETYQMIGNIKYPHDDKEYAKSVLEKR